jgi:high affinity Mn2+ porin
VFDLSQAPNTIALSVRRQFVAELEERQGCGTSPGKLKLLYWLTRGNLGTYLDAIALGEATGETPSTGAVRRFRTKDGYRAQSRTAARARFWGLCSRQHVARHRRRGRFHRHQPVDLGGSPTDRFALGAAGRHRRIGRRNQSNLSPGQTVSRRRRSGRDHRRRPTAGPEQILEAYYGVAVLSFARVAFDYQFINHPAYNRDRGPVAIFGLQLHLRY